MGGNYRRVLWRDVDLGDGDGVGDGDGDGVGPDFFANA
jgi:hypothetical protein